MKRLRKSMLIKMSKGCQDSYLDFNKKQSFSVFFKDLSTMFGQFIIGLIINDKVNMGQVWPKPKQIQINHTTQKPKENTKMVPTPPQSQIETSDAHLQTILNNTQNGQITQNNQEIINEQNILSDHRIKIQSTIKQPQLQYKQTQNQNINGLPTDKMLITLPEQSSFDGKQSLQPQSLRTVYEQDEAKVQQLFNKLLTDFLPAEELKLIKKQQHKRTLLLWLKQLPQSSAQQQRDKRLKGQGYHLYSTSDIKSLFAKFQHYEQLCLNIIVLVSYSEYFGRNETFKTLIEYFIVSNKLSQLIVVRPPQGVGLQSYKLYMNKLINNNRLIQINYQIELIRNYILNYETKQKSSCNFLKLRYWHNRGDLDQLIIQSDSYTMMCIRSKINLFAFGRIGEKIVERIANDTKSFQALAYYYSSLYDSYVNQKGKTRKEYLQKVALLMIEDPVRFYLLNENKLLIDRLLLLVADRLQHVTCILLPTVLISVKIKEEYELWNAQRTYKNQFRCYYDLNLSKQQLEIFKTGQIIENLDFIKAYLQPQKSYFNTQLVINVLPHKYSQQHDKGYCFISESNNSLSVDDSDKKSYFAGYDSVLFNFLNSFKVIQRRQDIKHMKNIIQLQYGYVAHHIELKAIHDYIPTEHENLIYRPSPKQSPDLITIIKYLSNYEILRSIEDFGDCFSLLGQHSQAIAYYEQLYRRNKADMKTAPLLLAQIQEKKGFNYQLRRNNSSALDNYYKAFNYIHRGPITRELQHIYSSTLKLMRRDGLHQKIVTFGPSIIRNGESHKNKSTYSESFRLQVHRQIALAHFSLTCNNYHCSSADSRINAHFECGLELVKQIGEYDQNVAVFYRQLGRYYLIKRQPIQGLTYLNKSLLILKSIHGEYHPILCEIYQYLAVGYIQTHDYNKAYNDIQQCISIYNIYYEQNDGHRLSCLQIEAYIRQQLGMKKQAVGVWRRQIDILRKKYGRDIGMNKKIEMVQSDVIGILRNAYQKERQSQSRSFLKMKKAVMSVTYCYAHIAIIYVSEYQYKEVVFELVQAIDMIKTEFPNDRSFQMDLHLIIARCYLKQTLLDQFWDKAKMIWREIQRNRIQRLQCAVKYHLLVAQAHSLDSKHADAFTSSVKAHEVAVKCYGCNTLDYCQIIDMVGRYGIKTGKLNQVQNYFNESKEIRTLLMTNINLNRHTIQLFGFDFEEYKLKVRLHLCFSIENKAVILMHKGETNQAIQIYKECLEKLREVVGEFHFYTAHISKELAKIYIKDKDSVMKALNCLNLSLSVFENMTEQPIIELVDAYSTMAKIKESMNQLGESIQAWSKVVILLRKSHQLNNGMGFLHQFKRIVQLILQHQNQNYFKMCYYLVSSTFQYQKKHDKVLKVVQTDVVLIITEILTLSQQLREKIKLQYYQASQQKNQTEQIINVQNCYVTLESIKQKMEQRKKKRKGLYSSK